MYVKWKIESFTDQLCRLKIARFYKFSHNSNCNALSISPMEQKGSNEWQTCQAKPTFMNV